MNFSKIQISTFLAILFHLSGVIGILFSPYSEWFIHNTPLNLLLMTILLIWNQQKINWQFILFFACCFLVGMVSEMIGVSTGILFGTYSYGKILGFKIAGVPLLIGLNWFVLVYSCIVLMEQIHEWVNHKYAAADIPLMPERLVNISIIIDGALLATFFDWIMEPAAVKLGFWQWESASIPTFNYTCWFIISALLIWVSRKFKFSKRNDFAVHLLMTQTLFFLTLRIFL